jgi:hypothetical protein
MTVLFLASITMLLQGGALADQQDELQWTNGEDLLVEGIAWPEGSAPWTRLPDTARDDVRAPVWNLSRHSAGIAIRFTTDSPSVTVLWTLTSDSFAMDHMPSTGVSGVDLYLRTASGWRWAGAKGANKKRNQATLVSGLEPELREFMLFLPLYNGVETVRIGTVAGYAISPGPDRSATTSLPIVFYGTSITQGACASRTGSCHPALLGRRLDRPVINLGFSGNGRLEMPLADLLGEIDAAIYVIDCLPNLNGSQTQERAVPFVKRLRSLRPETPILLVEDRTYGDAWVNPTRAKRNLENRSALKSAYEQLVSEGMENIAYLEGEGLLEEGATVDGSHPNDLGFMQQADAMEPAIRALLDSGSN